jgi:hypothetical protein
MKIGDARLTWLAVLPPTGKTGFRTVDDGCRACTSFTVSAKFVTCCNNEKIEKIVVHEHGM